MEKNSTLLSLSSNKKQSKFQINKSSGNNIVIRCRISSPPELLNSIVIGYSSALEIIRLSDDKIFDIINN